MNWYLKECAMLVHTNISGHQNCGVKAKLELLSPKFCILVAFSNTKFYSKDSTGFLKLIRTAQTKFVEISKCML